MELRHLRYFVAVAERLHFRQAAESLRVSQPALSNQIRQLESEVGARLLDRSTHHVVLTPRRPTVSRPGPPIVARCGGCLAGGAA